MQGIIDEVAAHVLRIQIKLYACRERLSAATDDEALHDLRIALRELRSLLRPLPASAECAELLQSAAALGRQTGPLRDLEVLQGYLRRHGLESAAQTRQAALQHGYAELLQSPSLTALLQALDDWPQQWREAAANNALRALPKLIRQRLRKDRRRLLQALQDPAHDRHRLRLLVKRLRYASSAYPLLSQLSGRTLAHLKQAQAALGDWHDHWQWLHRADTETDLQPCVAAWREAMEREAQLADQALQVLAGDFVTG